MNGTIIYYGVSENIDYVGGCRHYVNDWDEIRVDRVCVPHMLHLLMVQGLPIASVFTGEIHLGARKVNLMDWRLAKCSFPPIWEVPFYLRGVVLVKGDTKELTMHACLAVHQKKSA